MSHLGPDQLSALLDHELGAREREGAERHLGDCAACREALAALSGQEEALRRSLGHDPGEAYFASFADRVSERLRAQSLAGAQSREAGGVAAWFRSPRRMALVGGVAAVVAGAGVVLMMTHEREFPGLPPSPGVEQALQAAPPAARPAEREKEAPAAGAKPQSTSPGATTSPASRDRISSGDLAARPGHVIEVRRNEAGEDVPVHPPAAERRGFGAALPPPAAPAPAGQPVRVQKRVIAQPMAGLPTAEETVARDRAQAPGGSGEQAKGTVRPMGTPPVRLEERRETAVGVPTTSRVCGDVHDPLGRPVVGAQVVLRETGATATSDANGRFCLDAAPGEHTLAVMAVGFQPSELAVRADARQVASVRLAPVNLAWSGTQAEDRDAPNRVGEEGDRPGASPGLLKGRALDSESSRRGATDAFASLPAPVRAAAESARRLSVVAARTRTAGARSTAAGEWERLADIVPEGPAAREARFQAASERFAAWQIAPNARTADAAATALRRFLATEPAGPRRAEAEGWLGRVAR
jgi:hypothetical protein